MGVVFSERSCIHWGKRPSVFSFCWRPSLKTGSVFILVNRGEAMQSHRAWKTCQFWTFVHRWTKINSSSSYLKTRRELLLLSLSLCIKIHAVMCTVNTPHIHVWVNSLYEWLNYVSFSNALWMWQWYTYCGWSLPRRADVRLHMVEWKRIKGLICIVKSAFSVMIIWFSPAFL